MSEIQHYEFLKLGAPLTSKQVKALRAISERAKITPHSFLNVYNYGDLRADPMAMLGAHFDLHLYWANWGAQRLLVKLPKGALDPARVAPYYVKDWIPAVHETKWGQIVELLREVDEVEEPEWEFEGSLSPLLPIRDLLMQGDLRPLYIAWLAQIERVLGYEELDDDDLEPPVPPGLGELSGALRALAGFLEVDEGLLAAAAEGSAPLGAPDDGLEAWLEGLREADKDRLLLRVGRGGHDEVRAEMQRVTREARPDAAGARRTLSALMEAATRRKREVAEGKARVAAEAKAQEMALLAEQREALWAQADAEVERKNSRVYDEAVSRLKRLRELASYEDDLPVYVARIKAFMEKHNSKNALLRRISSAGLSQLASSSTGRSKRRRR